MSQKINWGIISTGHIAQKFAEALKLLPDANLVAVGSRNQATADEFGDKYDVPHRYSTYEELAQDPDVDIVYVATPHAFHMDNSILCMRAGKAVLCEKAFSINAAEAEKMIAVAREENVFLMEAMMTRHMPVSLAVQSWIEEGRIGEVRMVKASRCSRGEFSADGRHLNPALGGGSLLDVGVYVISFSSMIYRQAPQKAVGYGYIGAVGSDEQGAALLEYENGALSLLSFALRTETENEAYIIGTKGRIKVLPQFAVPSKAILKVKGEKEEEVEIPIEGNGLNYEAAEVMRCMRAGLLESPRMPLEESLHIMRTMDAIRKPWGLRYPNDDRII